MASGNTQCRVRGQGFIQGFDQNSMAYILLDNIFKYYLPVGLDHVNQSLHGLVDTLSLQALTPAFFEKRQPNRSETLL